MVRDGVALTKFFFWFEQNLTDFSADFRIDLLLKNLAHFRSEQENYLGPSFSAIVAFSEHGALPHYSAAT